MDVPVRRGHRRGGLSVSPAKSGDTIRVLHVSLLHAICHTAVGKRGSNGFIPNLLSVSRTGREAKPHTVFAKNGATQIPVELNQF